MARRLGTGKKYKSTSRRCDHPAVCKEKTDVTKSENWTAPPDNVVRDMGMVLDPTAHGDAGPIQIGYVFVEPLQRQH
jgi:hypothetical protein